jgi:hypothetical protein
LLLPFSVAVMLGSMMPDLDSDDGFPFKITFWIFAVATAGIVFYLVYQSSPDNLPLLIGVSLISFFLVRFVVGAIFKKLTHHRGMFHSLPAAAIGGLATYFLANYFPVSETTRQVLALGVGLGYLGHLTLDEIYATINFNGKKFRPSRSLGSALKLYSGSGLANIVCYLLIFLLFVIIFGTNQ